MKLEEEIWADRADWDEKYASMSNNIKSQYKTMIQERDDEVKDLATRSANLEAENEKLAS